LIRSNQDDFFFLGNTPNQNAISRTKPEIIKINTPDEMPYE
jgi:hypothetical protein